MLRRGQGEPLVLLHGVSGSAGHWEEVLPLVAAGHDAAALDALGHRHGRRPRRRPVTIADIVADAERSLDELGFERAHLAGNSMGGWMALELARRGRALTVTAFSPAGCWDPGGGAGRRPRHRLRDTRRDARRARPLLPLLLLSKRMRRYALRQNAEHGERLSRRLILDRTDDMLACTVLDDVLETGEALEPLDPPPCPVTIAWGRGDRVLPLDSNGERARELVPGARFIVFDDVGHVPMFDDPELVARTILATTAGAPSPSAGTVAG